MEEGKKYKFRLLGGNHVEPNPDPNAGPDENNEKGISYNKGDIIVTTRPLDKIFGANKFQRIYSDEQLQAQEVVVTEKPPVPAPETVTTQPEPEPSVQPEIPETPEVPNVE